jgi:hypothetical protein
MFKWPKSTKRSAALYAFLGWLFAVCVDPIVTIFRLNIETWAQENNYHILYKLPQAPEWLVMIWDFITGQFGAGFVIGALIFAFWDAVTEWWLGGVPIFRSARIRHFNMFHSEAVGHRNRVRRIRPDEFNYDDERARLVEWKSRMLPVARRININKVLRLENIDRFEPELVAPLMQDNGVSQEQHQIEAMWNEYLNRLVEFSREMSK